MHLQLLLHLFLVICIFLEKEISISPREPVFKKGLNRWYHSQHVKNVWILYLVKPVNLLYIRELHLWGKSIKVRSWRVTCMTALMEDEEVWWLKTFLRSLGCNRKTEHTQDAIGKALLSSVLIARFSLSTNSMADVIRATFHWRFFFQ